MKCRLGLEAGLVQHNLTSKRYEFYDVANFSSFVRYLYAHLYDLLSFQLRKS